MSFLRFEDSKGFLCLPVLFSLVLKLTNLLKLNFFEFLDLFDHFILKHRVYPICEFIAIHLVEFDDDAEEITKNMTDEEFENYIDSLKGPNYMGILKHFNKFLEVK